MIMLVLLIDEAGLAELDGDSDALQQTAEEIVADFQSDFTAEEREHVQCKVLIGEEVEAAFASLPAGVPIPERAAGA